MMDHWIVYLLAGVALIMGVGVILQTIATARDTRKYPPPGQLRGLGGYRLHIRCAGVGYPTVILEAGSNGSCLDWCRVQPEIAKFTQVCSYDRSGLGWSDRSPYPRSIPRIAEELHHLLIHSEFTGPTVLVGHSLGGLYLQFFARRYPFHVAGMVLVDSPHPEVFAHQSEAYARQIRAALRLRWLAARLGLMRLGYLAEDPASGFPPQERRIATAFAHRPSHWQAEIEQNRFLDSGVPAIMEQAGDFPNIPLFVITPSTFDWLKPMGPDMPAFWAESQKRLASLSANGKLMIAEGSSHWIPLDQPEIVVEAIRQVVGVVRAARSGS